MPLLLICKLVAAVLTRLARTMDDFAHGAHRLINAKRLWRDRVQASFENATQMLF